MLEMDTADRIEREHPIEVGSNRAFGLVMAIVVTLVALRPMLGGGSPTVFLFAIAAALAAISLIRPSVLRYPSRLWFQFGLLLHRIFSPIALGLVYYLVLTPTGLVRRRFDDPLRLRLDPQASSYWIQRPEAAEDVARLRQQF